MGSPVCLFVVLPNQENLQDKKTKLSPSCRLFSESLNAQAWHMTYGLAPVSYSPGPAKTKALFHEKREPVRHEREELVTSASVRGPTISLDFSTYFTSSPRSTR